ASAPASSVRTMCSSSAGPAGAAGALLRRKNMPRSLAVRRTRRTRGFPETGGGCSRSVVWRLLLAHVAGVDLDRLLEHLQALLEPRQPLVLLEDDSVQVVDRLLVVGELGLQHDQAFIDGFVGHGSGSGRRWRAQRLRGLLGARP